MPPLRVRWSPDALLSLQEIFEYLQPDSHRLATAQVHRIVLATRRLDTFPHSGRLLDAAPSIILREVIVPPYRVLYRATEEAVQIVLVVHSSRDLPHLLEKLELVDEPEQLSPDE